MICVYLFEARMRVFVCVCSTVILSVLVAHKQLTDHHQISLYGPRSFRVVAPQIWNMLVATSSQEQ